MFIPNTDGDIVEYLVDGAPRYESVAELNGKVLGYSEPASVEDGQGAGQVQE